MGCCILGAVILIKKELETIVNTYTCSVSGPRCIIMEEPFIGKN